MKYYLALLLAILSMPAQAAQTDGAVRYNYGTTGTNTTSSPWVQVRLESILSSVYLVPSNSAPSRVLVTDANRFITNLPAGSDGQVLGISGSDIVWTNVSGGGSAPSGTMVSSSVSVSGAVPAASDTTGTNYTPSQITILSNTNLNVVGSVITHGVNVTNAVSAGNAPATGAFLNFGTNAPNGYLIKSPSQSGISTNLGFNWTHNATPGEPGTAPDEVSMWGYNIAPGGNRVSTNDGSIAIALEGSYNPVGTTQRWAEMQLRFTDLTGVEHRPWAWILDKQTTAQNWSLTTKGNLMEWYAPTNSTAYFSLTPSVLNWRATAVETSPGIQLTSSSSNAITLSKLGGSATLDLSFSSFRNIVIGSAVTLNSSAISTFAQGWTVTGNSASTFIDGSSVEKVRLRGSAGVTLASDKQVIFSSTTASSGVVDTGLARDAAGVIRVTDGSSGSGVIKAFGFASTASDAASPITSGGWTNNLVKNVIVYMDGTGMTFTVYNSAGTPVYTNAATVTHSTAILQPGGKVLITAGSDITGIATPF